MSAIPQGLPGAANPDSDPQETREWLDALSAVIQAEGGDAAEVQMALMERSDLSVVIIGPMAPSAIDAVEDISGVRIRWSNAPRAAMAPAPSAITA